MKHEIGDMWKVTERSKTLWKVQFPKGIMTFNTKKIAMKWSIELKGEFIYETL